MSAGSGGGMAQFDEQSVPTYGNGYHRQQKMMKSGGQLGGTGRYLQTSPQQPQYQPASPYSQRQSLGRSADQRSLSNLRPASLSRGRAPIANLDSPFAPGIRIGHSLPPPQHQQLRQAGEMMDESAFHPQDYEDEFQQQQIAVPAPMVVPARGRQAAGAQRGGHNKNRRGRGGGRAAVLEYAPPPPGDTQHTYSSQRKPPTKRQSALQQKRAQQKQRELEMQMEEEQAKTFLEQEEQQNEAFFERQKSKKSGSGQQTARRGRGSPRKGVAVTERTAVPPADPTHPPSTAADQDSSKPPDDPFLPPQPHQMLLPLPASQQRSSRDAAHHHHPHPVYDSSALDGTINAVIRGEASVMQQRFGPPLTPGGQHYFQQSPPQFHQQSPYKMSPQQQQVGMHPTISSRRQQQQQYVATTSSAGASPPTHHQLSHQRLNDLAELAHASANLLEQTASRVVSFQQQQQQFQPTNKTLHFKVVKTNQDEQFDQDFTHPPQQQVFMVQQRTDQYTQHISAAVSAGPQQPTEVKAKRQRRSAPKKRTSSKVFEEEQPELPPPGFGEMMPGTSATAANIPIGEPVVFKGSAKRGGKFHEAIGERIASAETMEQGRNVGIGMMEQQEKGAVEIGAEETKPKRERKKRQQKEAAAAYETRCICAMTHNDPFMIQCDRCDVWQHGLCMGISEKNVPDEYLCEQCNPRKLKNTPKAAANAQQRALKLLGARQRTKKIAANMKRKSAPAEMQKKTPLGIRQGKVMKKSLAPAIVKLSKSFSMVSDGDGGGLEGTNGGGGGGAYDFEETNENGYSRGVRSYSRQVHSMITKMQPFVLGEIGLLKQLEKVSKARPMLVTPQHKGLVATQGKTTMPPGMPIIEYIGQVSLLEEVKALAPKKPINHEFTLIYSGLDERVLIDATKKGSMARFVRRSCRPNATIQHAIIDGKLRFYLYATTNIENSTEITIPFDYDYRHEATVPIECACGQNVYMNGNEQYCPVADFNKTLQARGIRQSPTGKGGGSPATSSLARATRQASNAAMAAAAAMTSGIGRGEMSPPKTIAVKEEMKSPATSPPVVGAESEGRQLRTRNPPSKSEQQPTPPAHGRATRSSTSIAVASSTQSGRELEKLTEKMSTENENVATKRKSRELKPTSSSYSDFVDAPPPLMPPVTFSQSHPMQAAGSGLLLTSTATLAAKSRPKPTPPLSMSPTPRKRGRPPTVAKGKGETVSGGKLTAQKQEKMTTPTVESGSNANLSREERKMQQTIDAYERAEQMRKRRSDEQQHQQIKTEVVSAKKTRISTTTTSMAAKKSKSAPSTVQEIFREFGAILREKMVGIEKDFELPSEFNKLRAKLTEQSQTKQQQGGRKTATTTTSAQPSKSAPSTATTTTSGTMAMGTSKKEKKSAAATMKESPKKAAKPPPQAQSKTTVKTSPPIASTTTTRVSKLQQRREREEAAAEAALKLRETAMPIGRSQQQQAAEKRQQQSKGTTMATMKETIGSSGPAEGGGGIESKGTQSGGGKATEEEQQKLAEGAKETMTTSTTESSSQQQLAAELAARVPNTKAQKKLTIEEYRRKKMADIEAKKSSSGGDGATKHQSPMASSSMGSTSTSASIQSSSSATPPTRQSPRKSFIPSIGAGATLQSSPPQQLEEFNPSTTTAIGGTGGGRHQIQYTPSLDELKKRILTSGSGSTVGIGSSSRTAVDQFAAASHSSSSHLPSDPLPPPPPPHYPKRGAGGGGESGADRASLDDRLKRLVSTTKRGN